MSKTRELFPFLRLVGKKQKEREKREDQKKREKEKVRSSKEDEGGRLMTMVNICQLESRIWSQMKECNLVISVYKEDLRLTSRVCNDPISTVQSRLTSWLLLICDVGFVLRIVNQHLGYIRTEYGEEHEENELRQKKSVS